MAPAALVGAATTSSIQRRVQTAQSPVCTASSASPALQTFSLQKLSLDQLLDRASRAETLVMGWSEHSRVLVCLGTTCGYTAQLTPDLDSVTLSDT